jgi:hypothetical protein
MGYACSTFNVTYAFRSSFVAHVANGSIQEEYAGAEKAKAFL